MVLLFALLAVPIINCAPACCRHCVAGIASNAASTLTPSLGSLRLPSRAAGCTPKWRGRLYGKAVILRCLQSAVARPWCAGRAASADGRPHRLLVAVMC